MNEILAVFIDRARLNLHDTRTKENYPSEGENRELSCFKCFLASKIDIFVRSELYLLANWLWRPTGCSVQFMLEGQFFRLLQQQDDETHLFRDKDEKSELLLVVSHDDRRFKDQLRVAIGDAIEKD